MPPSTQDILDSKLKSAEICVICSDPFNETHYPTALPCQHLFGTKCIREWLKSGPNENGSCPMCRFVIISSDTPEVPFDASSIWKAMCDQPFTRTHELMAEIWPGIKLLWKRKTSGRFSDSEILHQTIKPALEVIESRYEPFGNGIYNPISDCWSIIAVTWNHGPNRINGLARTLIRLARLMSTASRTLPAWLIMHKRMNRVIWEANACMDLLEGEVHWDMIVEASKLYDHRYGPLLYLYTVLVSQGIAHKSDDVRLHERQGRRHEIMNLVVKQCITKICGESWKGAPSNQFKDVLVKAYEKLRDHQLLHKKASLRGLDDEQKIVRAIWTLAWWEV